MTSVLSRLLFSSSARKLLIYYSLYCVLFLLFYLALVSTISFFHFLLDHDMGIIENWLNRNTWETLIFSKLLSASCTVKSLMLNNYNYFTLKSFIKKKIVIPEINVSVIVLFIVIFLYALLNQFGSELIERETEITFSITSYLGSILYYLIDFFVLFYSFVHIDLTKRQKIILISLIPIIFFVTTKVALPYVEKYTLFIFLHVITLAIFMFQDKKNFSNILLYTFFVIGPLGALLGIDLVWDNSYAFYSYPSTVPILGVFLIWLTALLYYFRSR